MSVHESGCKRDIAEIDHLRVSRDRQITANVHNLIALDDDDTMLHECCRFSIEHALRFEHDDVVGGPDWDRAGSKRKEGKNKPHPRLTTSQDIHSRDIEASREQSKAVGQWRMTNLE